MPLSNDMRLVEYRAEQLWREAKPRDGSWDQVADKSGWRERARESLDHPWGKPTEEDRP